MTLKLMKNLLCPALAVCILISCQNKNQVEPKKMDFDDIDMSITPFYEAFNVEPGDKNYKPESERIRIW